MAFRTVTAARGEATDWASVARFGLHTNVHLLASIDASPLFAGLAPIGSVDRHDLGDPFFEPTRPLRLTIASDAANDRRTHRELLALSRFPGVTVDILPGVPALGYERHVGIVDWDEVNDETLWVRDTQRPDFRFGAHVLKDAAAFVSEALGASADETATYLRETAAHRALGNHFLVSDVMARARSNRGAALLTRNTGVCTFAEAMRLAGTKARMVSQSPVFADDFSVFEVNVGMHRDLAVMHSGLGLSRAIGGAASPSAPTNARSAVPYLLAIRERLSDLLAARDAVYALERREAYLVSIGRAQSRRPEPAGNDLGAEYLYHVAAGLASAYSAFDNVALAVARFDGIDPGKRGFAELTGWSVGWPRGAASQAVQPALIHSPCFERALAVRIVRNAHVHRAELGHGLVTSDRAPGRGEPAGVYAMWISHAEFRDSRTIAGRTIAPAQGFRAIAQLDTGLNMIVTPRRLIDETWAATMGTIEAVLRVPRWPSRAWLATAPGGDQVRGLNRARRAHVQRRLWGW